MSRSHTRKTALVALALTVVLVLFSVPASETIASDHADAPLNSQDQGVDQGDTYAFLDPNDNTKLVVALTVRGFITPGEAVNMTDFDSTVRYRFEFETTGDAKPDQFLDVMCSKRTANNAPQTCTITLPNGRQFTAPTTVTTQNPTPPAPVITTDATSGASFFAGETDDPFFFDIPAFSRFVASVRAGTPNPSVFNRGRDTFAGYNILTVALEFPVSLLGTLNNNEVGIDSLTQRRTPQLYPRTGGNIGVGRFMTLDRSATPGINALIIPFSRKDEYNASTTVDDANGKFAPDIIATLTALGTNSTNINILASIVVTRGDFLRVKTNVPNTGTGGGTNSQAAFPDGRRPADDVVDTLLFFIANQNTLRDNVNANDVPFRDTFPFLAPPHQPLDSGVDDQTRN